MAEVLAQFDEPVVTREGRRYHAQACGAAAPNGLWDGWIEFIPLDAGSPVRSPRETIQPNRVDAAYWATGLTTVFLEGALDRALNPLVLSTPATAQPAFDAPAPDFIRDRRSRR